MTYHSPPVMVAIGLPGDEVEEQIEEKML